MCVFQVTWPYIENKITKQQYICFCIQIFFLNIKLTIIYFQTKNIGKHPKPTKLFLYSFHLKHTYFCLALFSLPCLCVDLCNTFVDSFNHDRSSWTSSCDSLDRFSKYTLAEQRRFQLFI